MEFVHGSYPGSRDKAADLRHLCVVRRNDEDVIETHWFNFAKTVGPRDALDDQPSYNLGNAFGFFRRAILVSLVLYRYVKKAGTVERRGSRKNLRRKSGMGCELSFVK